MQGTSANTVAVQNTDTLIDQQRQKLNDTLRDTGYYPSARYPGDCYIFDVVLGIDPRTVALDGVTEHGYRKCLFDVSGARVLRKGEPAVVTRKFTPAQRKALREWWYLLSPSARGLAW